MQMQYNRRIRGLLIMGLVFLFSGLVRAETYTWNGAAGSDWFAAANWTPSGPPAAGDAVTYTNAGTALLLTNETPVLSSFTMTDGTLTCTNWFTRIQAGNVTIEGGTITLPPAFTEADMSNRVWIVASGDFMLGANATIDTDGRGFAEENGAGAGATWNYAGGAGHGGIGGRGHYAGAGFRGATYGSTTAPMAPGSGGGNGSDAGGSGGGAVRVEASGAATINGFITADGGDAGTIAGGGSGGSIYITCSVLGGAQTGLLSADGGDSGSLSGGGGGGRIAVDFASVASTHDVRFATSPGSSWSDIEGTKLRHEAPAMGTVHVSGTDLLGSVLANNRFTDVRLFMDATSWTVDSLEVSNCSVVLAQNELTVTVTNNLTVDSGGLFGIGDLSVGSNYVLNVGGNLALTNGGSLCVYGGAVDATGRDYGTLVSVTGDFTVAGSSWVHSLSHGEDGGSPRFVMENLFVHEEGGFDAVNRGYDPEHGPGSPPSPDSYGAGGGYGGSGGRSFSTAGGPTNGAVERPIGPGSGGSNYQGGGEIRGTRGGGLIRIESRDRVTLHGALLADAGDQVSHNSAEGGGGSGGGIYVECSEFAGSGTGRLSVNGGNAGSSWCGGGGGGRIAILYASLPGGWPGVNCSAAPGSGLAEVEAIDDRWQYAAGIGSLYLSDSSALSGGLIDGAFSHVNLHVPDLDVWSVTDLVVSNATIGFLQPGFRLEVANHLTIHGGDLHLGQRNATTNTVLTVGGDLVLENAGVLRFFSGPTNGTGRSYGALARVTGTLDIAGNSWIYPTVHDTDGGSVLFRVGGLVLEEGSGINAGGRGYAAESGPGAGGAGSYGAGGGHGGRGGDSYNAEGGQSYGSSNAPRTPGSGGGHTSLNEAGRGGGVIRLDIDGDADIFGTLTAQGQTPIVNKNIRDGGGAGGSIFVRCTGALTGAPGNALLAEGGASGNATWSGPGGGGRIALWDNIPEFEWAGIEAGNRDVEIANLHDDFTSVTAAQGPGGPSGGSYQAAEAGTVVFLTILPPTGTIFIIR